MFYHLDNRTNPPVSGTEHFYVCIDGVNIVYCYIRKNACSAFKGLFTGESEKRDRLRECKSRLQFMHRYHGIDRVEDIPAGACKVLVYRDPIARVCSVFRNKFIAQSFNADIKKSVEDATGKGFGSISFQDFATKYLAGKPDDKDPHCRTQVAHLLPIEYNYVIPLDRLRQGMAHVISEEKAEKYFGKKLNASTGTTSRDSLGRPAWSIPAQELADIWIEESRLPSVDELVSAELRKYLSKIYSSDYQMIERLEEPSL